MPGMLAGPVRERRKFFNPAFMSGWADYNATNEAADEIVASPDRYLLSQPELFEAEGGWGTFGLSMGAGILGAAAVIGMRPGMAAHLGRGQLKAMEWMMVGGSAFAAHCVGYQVGVRSFGDAAKYDSHWMAYSFVKTQNRYIGGSILAGGAPTY